MSLATRAVSRALRLPPAVTRDIAVIRDLEVRTRDGIVLRADHYAPRLDSAPTVLVRTPYGRRGVLGLVTGRVLAERGFHVVLQSCRGTFGSGGHFVPMRHEREDGLDTLAWLEKEPWFDGNLFTYGPSYVGFTQWAIAAEAGPMLRGMLTAVTASSFRGPTYAGGSFSLDTILNWATLVRNQGGSLLSFAIKQNRTQPLLRRAWTHLPLAEIDTIASGGEIDFFQEWLARVADEAYWLDRGHDHRLEQVTAPVCMVSGWYDIFLPWQLADYERLVRAGRAPRLVIGPWSHSSRELFAWSMREGIAWFRAQCNGGGVAGDPVRVHVGGADEWRAYPRWPPVGGIQEWTVGPGGVLAAAGSGSPTGADRFRYDPADPTPSPGGPLLTTQAGRRDNSAVEARPDVLIYSTEPLAAPIEVVGPVSATVRLRSSSPYFDLFVRLCDVNPDGRSENICDGLVRVSDDVPVDADGVRAIDVALWPTAYRWRAGHRLRMQIAGGAHPRYARNPGSGEPLGSATTLRPVSHEVLGSVLRLHVPR